MLFLPVSVSVALLTFAYFLTKPLGNASKNYSFEDFVCVCREIMPQLEENICLENFDSVEKTCSKQQLSLMIYKDKELVFSSGKLPDEIENFLNIEIDNGIYATESQSFNLFSLKNDDFKIILAQIKGSDSLANYDNLFDILIVICAILSIIFVVFFDRFLMKFVFDKIENPLKRLSTGVNEISSGNLDYKIAYDSDDEFSPVCKAFNQMADRLKDSTEALLKADSDRKELVAGLSHDLKTPLTSIRAYTEGLLSNIADTDEKRERYLRTILEKEHQLEEMVHQLLTFSKMELDSYKPKLEECDLVFEIEQIILPQIEEYKTRGLLIECNFKQTKNCKVLLDRELLERICANILSNSLKYKNKDTGTIVIACNYGKITFSDDGSGVPKAALQKLFDIFYRADPARANTGGGNGIGLAVVAKAVSFMGGTVRAENNRMGGLSVIIELPPCGANNE